MTDKPVTAQHPDILDFVDPQREYEKVRNALRDLIDNIGAAGLKKNTVGKRVREQAAAVLRHSDE